MAALFLWGTFTLGTDLLNPRVGSMSCFIRRDSATSFENVG